MSFYLSLQRSSKSCFFCLNECCCNGDILHVLAGAVVIVVFPLFIFDQVNEEVDGAVEGCHKVTQTGDQLNPVWPVINLTKYINCFHLSRSVSLY